MTLINLIKNSQNIRKIFGKKELKIIEKQLLGINLSPSEKTRLSRDIRKKFEAVKELSAFSEEFKLKKSSEIKREIEQAVEIIKESPSFKKIKKIILFGSTKEKNRTFRSDIDIGVEFDDIDAKKATEFRIWVMSRVPERADIQVINLLPEKIKDSISKNYKILYEK